MKKGPCSEYAFIAVLWTSPPESPDYAMARSLAALATEITAGDSRPTSRTPNHDWRARHCRPSAWQPRDRSRRGTVSRLTEGCTDDRTPPRSPRVEVFRDPGAGCPHPCGGLKGRARAPRG